MGAVEPSQRSQNTALPEVLRELVVLTQAEKHRSLCMLDIVGYRYLLKVLFSVF